MIHLFSKRWQACFLFILLSAVHSIPLLSQSKEIDKANELYNLQRYSDAATWFEEALSKIKQERGENRTSVSIKTKLAYCYRMNNKMDKAEALYASVVEDERISEEVLFYYGEALMSNGKYDEAKNWFRKYQTLKPEDERTELMIKSCLMVPFIEDYFMVSEIQPYKFNSDADDNAPVLWKGGILFSSDRKQGPGLIKEKSGWTGRDFLDLYYSSPKVDGSFAEPERFSARLSQSNKNTGNASISKDGQLVFFTRNDNELNRQNTYNLQIYQAESAGDNRWKNVQKLPFCSPSFNFMHPALSPDGKTLYFTSNKNGGEGGTDLWVAALSNEVWGRPENLGPNINSSANEGFPFIDDSGRLFFCSKGHPGFGGFDIFVVEKDSTGNWTTPRNLGKPINSSLDDISIFYDDKLKSGLFTSSRDGGDDDIYIFKTDHAGQLLAQETKDEAQPQDTEQDQLPTITPVLIPVLISGQKVDSVIVQEPPIDNSAKSPPAEKIDLIIGSQEIRVTSEDSQKADSSFSVVSVVKEIVPIPGEIPENDGSDNILGLTTGRGSFAAFEKNLTGGMLRAGDVYTIEGVSFDPNVWQITLAIKSPIDKLCQLLKENTVTELEIGVHTESLGPYDQNLILSDLRARMVMDYMHEELGKGVKLSAVGYGETQPLNHCTDNSPCSIEEHLLNNRLEIKIIKP
jgi:outer membrane protein OmpA-like peptidoglycan-associated protein/tetratricopeptide (TPR) repeat protein